MPPLDWRLDPSAAPMTGERRDGWPLGGLIVGIGTLWIALALRAPPDVIARLGEHGAHISLAIGTTLVLWGCRLLARRQTIHVDRSQVRVTLRQLGGTAGWTEPLVNYRGVVWRTAWIRRRHDWRTLQLIDLCHADASKTVNLFSSTDDAAVREAWHGWAKALGLAAIRQNPARRPRGPVPRFAGRASAVGYVRVATAEADFRAAASVATATSSAWLRISATETISQSVPRTIGPAPNSRGEGRPSRPIRLP
jgi:hypothetical protein